MTVFLCVSMLTGLFGCSGKDYVVGDTIREDDITEFYWTKSTSTYPPTYQRYQFRVENGNVSFYHESRNGDRFPLTEEDITASGMVKLTDEEKETFFSLLKDGKVRERRENTSSGDGGPWTYLYWKSDKGKIQEFSFASRQMSINFEAFCQTLKENETALVRTVNLGSNTMDYIRFGKQNGEKIVILPGLSLRSVMGSAKAIVAAYALLAEEYEIYLFDHVAEEPEDYTIKGMAEDTLKAMQSLGLEHVHLMGVSMGGMVAQQLTLDHSEVVDSLILCSTSSRQSVQSKKLLETWKELAEGRVLSVLMESFGENVYSPSFYETYKDIIIASGNGASERDYNNFIRSVNAVMEFDVYKQLQYITCPVYVLGAGQDKVLGAQASTEIMKALSCDGYIYEDYGHGVYDEAPDFLQHVLDFLKGEEEE